MMSGINGGNDTGANSGTDGAAAAPKRRRRRKIEEYDQEDPFVDDTDLLFEAQAATSKDGFFVCKNRPSVLSHRTTSLII
jgi:hypothetical protein